MEQERKLVEARELEEQNEVNNKILKELVLTEEKRMEEEPHKEDERAAEKKGVDIELDSRIYIEEVNNNIRMTLTNNRGDVIYTISGGLLGFKGRKRKTTYAGQEICRAIVKKIEFLKLENLIIILKGSVLNLGMGLFGAVRELCSGEIASKIKLIMNRTSRPFNGCRLRKRRKV